MKKPPIIGLPVYQDGETLASYLVRALGKSTVDLDAVAHALLVTPTILHDAMAGAEPEPGVLATWGALTGVLVDRPHVRRTLHLLGLLQDAERGWAQRA